MKLNKIYEKIKVSLFAVIGFTFSNQAFSDFSFSIENKEINVAKQMMEDIFREQHNLDDEKKIKDSVIANVVKNANNKNQKEVKKIGNDLKNKNDFVNVSPKKTVNYNSKIMGNVKKGETCWDSAAKYHNVDPWLLYSIAYVESRFNPNAIGKNKNGTKDLGMMQINDKVWLPKLKKMGITKNMLKDPCVSVYIGAWILRQNIDEFGYTAKAIGAYNSRTPVHNRRYAKKVYEAYAKFTKLHKIQTAGK